MIAGKTRIRTLGDLRAAIDGLPGDTLVAPVDQIDHGRRHLLVSVDVRSWAVSFEIESGEEE